jgi:hypothetical protein
MKDDIIEHLSTYNQGDVEGSFSDILGAIEPLEKGIAAAEEEQYAKRTAAIEEFVERNGSEIQFQRERAENTAERVLKVVQLKQRLDQDLHAHEEILVSHALASVMHNLNETARVHGMIVRLLSGDHSAVSEVERLQGNETTL